MKICGLQKTTLLDYPGHMAATIFLGGCNFRCPFCHNSDLLDGGAEEFCSKDELLSFLSMRAPILEGVCITGGEPTLFPKELEALIRDIRSLGYLVKLDTNGYRPQVLKHLCDQQLLDFVAMDIKTCKSRYQNVAGLPSLQMDAIEESVRFLMEGHVPYEFRTTVVKELHHASDFAEIGQWLSGCSNYFLQNFVNNEQVLTPGFSSYDAKELLSFVDILKPYIPTAALRGVAY